ncbi:MAG TPA: hypothetical protein VKV17_02375 [Bryobacteraceae bacterium]|nr:hypothetical protein [Bryobacteraceae bacterium]
MPITPAGNISNDAGENVERAVRDLESRTLAHFPSDLSKVVYLAGTRDYNTGEYHHAGLIQRFGREASQTALARCHEAAFGELLRCGLDALAGQLAGYMESTGAEKERVLRNWRQMEAYRMLVPANCDPLSADFFISNIRIALEALKLDMRPDRRN